MQTLANERPVVNGIVSTNEPGQARLSPAPPTESIPVLNHVFDSAVPSELYQSQWCFWGLSVNACGNMQGTGERGHQENLVSLEDTLLPARLPVRVLVSRSSQAGFLRRAPAPVPRV